MRDSYVLCLSLCPNTHEMTAVNRFPMGGGDYAEILRHAVSVFEHTRIEIVARHEEKMQRSVALLPWLKAFSEEKENKEKS